MRILCLIFGHVFKYIGESPHQKCKRCGGIKYGKWDFKMWDLEGLE